MRFLLHVLILPFLLITGFSLSGQSPLLPRDASIKGPQTFAIVMGISKYKYVRPLAYADKDAELFRDYLKSPNGGSVKDGNIFCLLNEEANNANFWGKGFQWLKAKELQKGDRLFIYLAGHGDAIDEEEFFFLGYDCNPKGDKNNYLVSGAIQLYNLKKKIRKETSKGVEVFFIMDACRSNELPGGVAGQSFLNMAISERKVGDIMMLATAAGQESLEDISIGNGHGLFTYYLIDGLNGLADTDGTPDNKITLKEIKSFVDVNVPSLALRKFKKKQDPYFCCNEFNENVVSRIDTAYLQKWLKNKKEQNRGGGNSFSEFILKQVKYSTADTALVQMYNLFYKAVKSDNISGKSSAEYFFGQLNNKYPGNPYTLDAKSTLAVKYINVAQQKVDNYLSCSNDGNAKEKQGNYEAAINLEKAIALVSEDDEDFANSLLNRVYLLKANGDFGKEGKNGEMATAFQHAYTALAIDPNGAYIYNKLAQLHIANNQIDSASFYANKATKIAPNWACAFSTLAIVQKALTDKKNPDNKKKQPKNPVRKSSFGIALMGGINQSKPSFSGNINSGFIGVASNTAPIIGVGFNNQVKLGKSISVRPAISILTENTKMDFQKRGTTGGPATIETLSLKGVMVNIAVPLLIRLSSGKITPYIVAGPAINNFLRQKSLSNEILPVNKFSVIGDGGLGVDFNLINPGVIISPELTYSAGITDVKDKSSLTAYSVALSSLKRNAYTLRIYIRKR